MSKQRSTGRKSKLERPAPASRKSAPAARPVEKRPRGRPKGSGKPVAPAGDSGGTAASDEWTRAELVARAADLAWSRGLAPAAIAKELWPETGATSERIMEAKRLLISAVSEGFLEIHSPRVESLEQQLAARFQPGSTKPVEYRVVDDEHLRGHERPTVAVAAARMLIDCVRKVLDARRKLQKASGPGMTRERLNIGNTGGPKVNSVVSALARLGTEEFDEFERRQLQFIALNSAGRGDHYHESANFLAVRLAEIFRSPHHLALHNVIQHDVDRFEREVNNIDILLSGCGTSQEGLLREYARERAAAAGDPDLDIYPTNAVGDLCFNLLDSRGQPVSAVELLRDLKVHPTFHQLQRIALTRTMIVVVDAAHPEQKEAIARAVLTAGLCTHCVLGSKLARLLLKRS